MRKYFWIIAFQFTTGFYVAGQAPLRSRDTTIKGSQTFAMILGISRYKYVQPLAYADKDAELFRDYLRSPGGGSVKRDNMFVLLNEKASNANFWSKGFQWLRAKKLQKGDRLFIYLAGHGDAIDEDQFFFLGYDCNPAGDKNNYLIGGAIQLFNLKKKIAEQTTKGVEVFFIMDACRSNELPGGLAGQNFLNSAISEKKVGEIIMLATGAGQESLEDASLGTGHGLFTYYLVDGLSGVADSIGAPDNKITFSEIQKYVDRNVPSVAQQRFKRKQDPYFCCNENNDKIVSIVDTAYLSNWLKTKKRQTRGPGNSTSGDHIIREFISRADTTLIQAYDLFNKAISNNNLTGRSSAEYYYQQMERKYPGDPYTLDAKTTLAAEFIIFSQDKVNQYLNCIDPTVKEKQEFYEAGNRLEKAIGILREDEPDFCSALVGRMYFLKASGDLRQGGANGDLATAFRNAYAALAIDHNAAYISNWLATLHMNNNNPDSAVYYANRAIRVAPRWRCSYATLATAYKSLNLPDSVSKYRQKSLATDPSKPVDSLRPSKKKESRGPQFGIVAGSGISSLRPKIQIKNNDTLMGIGIKSIVKFDIGFIARVSISKTVAWRPSLLLSLEGGSLTFTKRASTGVITTETIKLPATSILLPMPVVFKFGTNNGAPFVSLGPTFSFLLQQGANNSPKLPLKSFELLGDIGAGVDLDLSKGKLVLSPELKYSRGITSSIKNVNNFYTNSISSLRKQAFTFSIYLRKG